jgi:cytidyltransferase-like protein
MSEVFVYGAFDDIHAGQMRFLEEAARLGDVHLLLWSDDTVQKLTGQPPKFPATERRYYLEAARYVTRVSEVCGALAPDALPHLDGISPACWVGLEDENAPARRDWCAAHGVAWHEIPLPLLNVFPPPPAPDLQRHEGRKKVLVTGCYDWLHSGHVRFFEEASAFGELYVIVGNDANVSNLKGEGHPLFPEKLRRYMTGSIRFVHQALITSGWGWMDAEPEIKLIRPDIYLVNEDGDKPEKREFCAKYQLEYVVLKRLPKQGLQPRSSTDLRGF